MHILLSALAILALGCLVPLLLYRQYSKMQIIYIMTSFLGCLLGLCTLPAMVQQEQMASTFACSWLHSFTLTLSLDSLTVIFLVPVFLLAPFIALYSCHYLKKPASSWRAAINYSMFSLLIVSMALLLLAGDMVVFFLAWELMSVASFLLILFEFEQEENQRAAYLYFVFTQAGALCILASFGLLYSASASLSFAEAGQIPQHIKTAVFFLGLLGFGSKAGIIPLHIWLPHAHPAAPSHVSAILSGVMIKMGVYGIVRMFFSLGLSSPLFGQIILILGISSGILGVVYALGKHDIKRLLAYHSIENIGIILIGIGLGMLGLATNNIIMASFGFAGGLLHVLNHGLFKSLLFMGAGAVLQATGLRHIDQMGGLLKRMPVTGSSFLTGSVAISGLPPFNGFISEFLIYFAAFQGLGMQDATVVFSMAAIISLAAIGALASACFTKVMGIVFLGEARCEQAATATESGKSMQIAMVVLASGCLLIGLWPEPFIRLAFFAISDFLPASHDAAGAVPAYLGMGCRLFFLLLLFITLLQRLLYLHKTITRSSTWGCGFSQASARVQYTGTSYARSMTEFHQPLVKISTKYSGIAGNRIFPGPTRYESRVDDIAELGFQRFLVKPILWGANKLLWIQQGRIQLYIAYIILTIVVVLLAA